MRWCRRSLACGQRQPRYASERLRQRQQRSRELLPGQRREPDWLSLQGKGLQGLWESQRRCRWRLQRPWGRRSRNGWLLGKNGTGAITAVVSMLITNTRKPATRSRPLKKAPAALAGASAIARSLLSCNRTNLTGANCPRPAVASPFPADPAAPVAHCS